MNIDSFRKVFPVSVISMLLSLFVFVGLLQAEVSPDQLGSMPDVATWFGTLELPFLFSSVIFAFLTASALKGGMFGRGMVLMAWSFLVMGVGHIHMQLVNLFQFNVFDIIFGKMGGSFMWFAALILTWVLSWLGFRTIYKASASG
jgi:hypothetical protein